MIKPLSLAQYLVTAKPSIYILFKNKQFAVIKFWTKGSHDANDWLKHVRVISRLMNRKWQLCINLLLLVDVTWFGVCFFGSNIFDWKLPCFPRPDDKSYYFAGMLKANRQDNPSETDIDFSFQKLFHTHIQTVMDFFLFAYVSSFE